MGLGPIHAFSLAEARERARKARQMLADGIDPLDEKRQERQARQDQARAAASVPTFEEAARRYFRHHGPKWRNAKHRAQFLSTLETYAYPHIGQLRVTEVETDSVLRVLEPIWFDKTETASRVRGRIEKVLSWAKARGYTSGENPARWSGHLAELLPARSQIQKTRHHRALPFDDLSSLMAELRQREGVAARALEFAILTAARTGEVIGARWDEIDVEKRVWTVPAERMKARKQQKVPLSDRALEILSDLPRERDNPYVFVSTTKRGAPLSNMAMATVLRRMGRTDITVHGFRSTFRDWAAERTSYPNHVVEQALAHTIGNRVEAAYRRGDLFQKRARLMADWARFATSEPKVAGAEVVSLRRA